MKIGTYNINGVRKRLGNLLEWLAEAEPDVVCLQELKATDAQFPRAAIEAAGYGAVWRGQSAWNGVAILARGAEPVRTRDALPGDASDAPARYIEAAAFGVLIASLYAPNGNPQPGPKYDAKLDWHARLNAHASDLLAAGVPVALVGDYNVAPTPEDVYATHSYDDNALIQPASRALFAELVGQGWTDAIRERQPEGPAFTFWDYRRNRWPRDAGMRLDHLLLSPSLAQRLQGVGIDRAARDRPDASDHAPVWIEVGAGG